MPEILVFYQVVELRAHVFGIDGLVLIFQLVAKKTYLFEQLSEKVIREIAWEVVPELSEILIKKKLEETR